RYHSEIDQAGNAHVAWTELLNQFRLKESALKQEDIMCKLEKIKLVNPKDCQQMLDSIGNLIDQLTFAGVSTDDSQRKRCYIRAIEELDGFNAAALFHLTNNELKIGEVRAIISQQCEKLATKSKESLF